ncbi:hypothetical protein ACWECC_18015 [Streptomyces microflavus]
MKQCNTCKKNKPERDYHKNKTTRDGLSGKCKKCQAAYIAQWKKDNKARVNELNAQANKRRLERDPEGERAKRNKWAKDWYRRNKKK